MHTKQHPLCSSSHDELTERVMTYRQQLLYFSFVIHQSVPSKRTNSLKDTNEQDSRTYTESNINRTAPVALF